MKFERDLIIIGIIWTVLVVVLSYTFHRAVMDVIEGGGFKVLIEQLWEGM